MSVEPSVFGRVRRGLFPAVALFGFGLLSLCSGPVLAACSDPPEQGVNWQRCGFDGLDLSDVELTAARLRDGSFFRSNLQRSRLDQANGFRAKFVNADLRDAVLDGANMAEADFTKADLSGASLVGADLRRARLYRAVLRGADLTNTRLRGADLTGSDLSGARWTDGERICAEGSVGRCNQQSAREPKEPS